MTTSRRARRLSVGVEAALAFTASAASFALTSAILVANGSDVVAAVVAVVAVLAIVAVSRSRGLAYALPMAVALFLPFDWYFVPPTHPDEFPDAANLGYLLAFIVVAVLVGGLIARAGRRAETSESARSDLAGEQAALRRVATLVARGVSPPEVFEAVSEEVGKLLGVSTAYLVRYEPEGEATVIGSWRSDGTSLPVNAPARFGSGGVLDLVRRTGHSARVDDYDDLPGKTATEARRLGMRSAVAAPIVVVGHLWGAMAAASGNPEPLGPSTESRMAAFTELVATAISNTEARAEAERLGEEQAALRRVATLVAQGSPPTEVFAKVAEEVGLLLGVESAWMQRYEADGDGTLVAIWGELTGDYPIGMHLALQGKSVTAIVRDTLQPARMDDYSQATGAMATYARESGVRSCVGSPIVVDGELWGSITAIKLRGEALPAGAESRIAEFTELVATAISNVQARSELAGSRARIVAATEEERRRVVRDLHDGAQQRLVHTIVTLKLARRALENDPAVAPALISEAQQHSEEATAELRELAHGILPLVLTSGGLRAGVVALASRCPIPVEIAVAVDRLPAAIEATAYFLVAEALTNVAKHAHADHAKVTAQVTDGVLQVQVRDDGVGGACVEGSGLLGLGDRLDVIDGSMEVDSPTDGGTLVAAVIPVR